VVSQLSSFGKGAFYCTTGLAQKGIGEGGDINFRMAAISNFSRCGGYENWSILAMVDKQKDLKAGVNEKVVENLKKDMGSDCEALGESECDQLVKRQVEAMKRDFQHGDCGEHDKEATRGKTVKLSVYDCQRLRVVNYAYSPTHAM